MTRLLAAGLALVAALAAADVAVPPVARVTDQTGTLSADQRASLEQRLEALERDKGSQVAVLIVPTTQPETIEQYGIRVAEAWKLGRKGVDDGLILLVAKDDRTVRIEVGYGLEGVVPDAIANRVIDEIIVPRFRQGDFYGGISAGVDQLLRLIEGEALPPPRRAGRGADRLGNLLQVGFGVLFLSLFLGRAIGEFPSSLAVSGLFGIVAWVMLHAVATAAIAAVVMFVLSLVFQVGRARGGGYGGGGLGGIGGGGFGGGGFGGGGGGFGGGGASGRW